MPLLDHFRPLLSERRPWESFHTTWASAIRRVEVTSWSRAFMANFRSSVRRSCSDMEPQGVQMVWW